MNLLEMKSGNVLDPFLIRGIVKFPGKGVVFKNEYNKTMVYEPETDPFNQDALVKAVVQVLRAGKAWEQPDWAAEYAKADKARAEAKARAQAKSNDASRAA
ncbi:hypothetical protein [Zoogloea sp.]|uniref:hypothetical protein n=1 Tax=Zoogloea sp. TaxID=49181 RepID=UPI00260A6C2A|nr:hypothetical protein [Zoogloea sp.]MDD3352258.1 hypothetical protein [Zoogloea sp.]